MRIAIDTLGCKVNRYDSVVLEGVLLRENHEIVPSNEPADCYIVNSCTVTKGADADTRQLIRKFQKRNNNALIVVTGCSAQMQPEVYASMPGVHFVVGSDLKNEIPKLIKKQFGITPYVNVSRVKESGFALLPIKKYSDWSRAFIKVQEGCDNFCTFCIIPYSRGRSRSHKVKSVVDQINVLVDEGYKEVVITGIDLMTYGKGLSGEENILTLVESILNKTKIERLRISSIEPSDYTNRLISIASHEARLCPHFHLSIQSCNDEVLKRMRRRYSLEDIKKTFDVITHTLPDAFIGIDMIAGFSGESDKAHSETVSILSDTPWCELHVFQYSEREGTAGIYLEDRIANSLRTSRAKELRELSKFRFNSYLRGSVGKVVKVLPEKYRKSDGEYHRTISREYLQVLVPKSSVKMGRELRVQIDSQVNGSLFGTIDLSTLLMQVLEK